MSLIGVSPLLGFASATSQLDRLREDMEHAQLVATTGLEVAKPSDAPGEWTLIHGLSASIADQQRFSDASDLTVPILKTADSAVRRCSCYTKINFCEGMPKNRHSFLPHYQWP